MTDSKVLKTVGFVGLEGFLNFLLQTAEDLERFLFSLANRLGESLTYRFKIGVFDCKIFFRPCEVYCFQNLVDLELQTKHTLNFLQKEATTVS